ncbi:sugar transferase [Sphingosinicella sp. BN140058]|uniref:sugar transferase n=1 Tax=Sphingosinicella sp. BN140058 TaxID=1892855 RepID=UPI0010104F72|nr:sugar transferase [Sphingosinicella sp. BN140058]QAY78090.1 sugar transferase [Sphingosinicella sp. BN140058]
MMDIVGALILIPLTIPLMAVLYVVVLAAMGRPVMFMQERSGRGGVPFEMMKFRSMRDMRDSSGMPLPDQVRVTPFGRLLRRSRLDELPELWNILAGEMSFIGPRPLLPETIASMGVEGRIRGTVRPGLSGWAQISGNSSLTNDDKLALDLWYIRNRSLRLDVFILVKTLELVVFGERICEGRLSRALSERGLRDRPGHGADAAAKDV